MKRKTLRGEGLDHFFEMHGRRDNTVHRQKRNGEFEEYEYVYHPPSSGSPLKDRTIVINRFANTVSNPQYKGYSAVLRKLYYYTPYFLTAGSYKLQGQTVFFVREDGNYTIAVSSISEVCEHLRGFSWEQRVCRRTKLNFTFSEEGEYEVTLSRDGIEHCRRRFIVIADDIQEAYTDYLEEHLEEILAMPEPGYSQIKIYRRGLVAKTNVVIGVSGTYRGQIYYWHKGSNITFLRTNYDHSENEQSQRFKVLKSDAVSSWNAESEEFKAEWRKLFWQWYNANFRRLNRMMTPYMRYVGEYVKRLL